MTEAKIYVTNPSEEYFLATIPVLPGCIASGKTRDDAIAKARRAFGEYRALLEAHGVAIDHWKDIEPDELPVGELESPPLVPGEDRPFEEHEIRDFLHQYEASRAAVIALVTKLSPEQLETAPNDTIWSVRQALEHMMTTDIALLSRLEKWPVDPLSSYQAVHRIIIQRFSVMEPDDWRDHTIIGRRWTTKRVMRRLLEHEFEHYQHIREIIAALT
ncbi:MAG TPA: type II toxin-antitoxin system HicB family antitoxin [Candidatus Limnocylindria bacterium]|jgi:predicted RNase H-like HicB family nuclease|nr:type II toxin-antitoxin system HicB family antitoxin [Candidatus Limnocylindria bacterium]